MSRRQWCLYEWKHVSQFIPAAREMKRRGHGHSHHIALIRLYSEPRRLITWPRMTKLAATSGVGAMMVVVILLFPSGIKNDRQKDMMSRQTEMTGG